MSNLVVSRMSARKRGRPRKSDMTNEPVRLAGDLYEKIRWIIRIAKLKGDETLTANGIIEPMIRPQVEAKYKLIEPDVEKLKATESQIASDGESESGSPR